VEEEEDLAMNSAEVSVDGCNTLPKLFLKKSAERGERIAMREKDFGIWQSYSWNYSGVMSSLFKARTVGNGCGPTSAPCSQAAS
jgi:long-chain acyl-CoA synthetase